MLLPALAAKIEVDMGALDVDMAVLQRGQPEGAVGPRIFVVADPDQRRFQQTDDGGQQLFPGKSRQGQILVELGANPRKRAAA